MKKNIQQLKESAWFRFLTVIYFIFMLLVGIGLTVFSFDNNRYVETINADESSIVCLTGNKKKIPVTNIGIHYLNNSNIRNGDILLNQAQKDEVYTRCQIEKIITRDDFMSSLRNVENKQYLINEELVGSVMDHYLNNGYQLLGYNRYSTDPEYAKSGYITYVMLNYKTVVDVPNKWESDIIYKRTGGIAQQLSMTFVYLIATFIAFEIIKRLFYYIFIGNFFPKKDN